MSELVRKKYADKDGYVVCFTCGKPMHWKESQAGHAIGGRTNYLLFECEEVIRNQCSTCNVFKGGNYSVFIPKLIEEYGHNGVEISQSYVKESRKVHKYTKKDYVALVHELEARLEDLG